MIYHLNLSQRTSSSGFTYAGGDLGNPAKDSMKHPVFREQGLYFFLEIRIRERCMTEEFFSLDVSEFCSWKLTSNH